MKLVDGVCLFCLQVHYDDSAVGKTRELAYAQLLSCYKLARGTALSAFFFPDSIRRSWLVPVTAIFSRCDACSFTLATSSIMSSKYCVERCLQFDAM